MRNPILLFNELREMFLRYLDSPFDLRYPDLVRERRSLLDRDGRLYREPLIEAIPVYEKCLASFPQVAQSILAQHWTPQLIDELATFAGFGLFPNDRRPYTHQKDAFAMSVVDGRDVVITTGTGSGKTECFFLPIAAALIKESLNWDPPNIRGNQSDWWRHYTMQGKRKSWAPRISQRAHETRPAAEHHAYEGRRCSCLRPHALMAAGRPKQCVPSNCRRTSHLPRDCGHRSSISLAGSI